MKINLVLFLFVFEKMKENWFEVLINIISGRKLVSHKVKLEGVTIGITVVHAVMFLLFVHFDVWPMIIYNGIVVAYYLYVLRTVHVGNIAGAYVMTFIEIAIQVLFGSFMLGWNIGFFLYLFAIIPLFFYLGLIDDDVNRSQAPSWWLTLAAVVIFFGSYAISYHFDPLFELDVDQIEFMFMYNSVFSMIMLAAMSRFFVIERRHSLIKMAEENRMLDIEASEDPLTGLTNRRSMEKYLEKAMTEARRFDKPFSLIMGDIDSFKQINDTYGHDMGDVALKSVTAIFRQSIGNDDVICRWGGEEFLLLINGDGARATLIAETVRKKVEENLIVFKGTELKFTMTLGVTYYKPGYDLDSLIKQADNNMYYGKRHGKNQVVSKELVY